MTMRLREKRVAKLIEQAFEEGRREAYHGLYDDFCSAPVKEEIG